MKPFLLVFLLCVGLMADMDKSPLVGIYKVTDNTCKKNRHSCDQVRFIEIRTGTFYGVKKDELVLVHWSGYADSELFYEAREINKDVVFTPLDTELLLFDTKLEKQVLYLKEGKPYKLFTQTSDSLSYSFMFEKADDNDLAKYKRVYPVQE